MGSTSSVISGSAGHLLLIDDDPDFAQVVKEMLAPHGYEVEIASDRTVGRQLAGTDRHDLIIIDAILESPVAGIELARELRSIPSQQHKPLLLISTMTGSPHFPERFATILDHEWPFDGYLEKPVDQERLLRFLRHLVPTPKTNPGHSLEHQALVLIVDDDPDQQTIARETLSSAGIRVECVFNSYEAREWLKKNKPQLILLDVMMTTPTEGFDFAYELRDIPDLAPVPIIMVSGMMQSPEYPRQFERILGRDWPAARFLEKPVSPGRLLEEVKKVFRW